MKRKQPVILLLIFGIGLGYLVHNYRLQNQALYDAYEQATWARKVRMSHFLVELESLGKRGYFDVARTRLEDLRVAGVYDFYILQDQGSVLWWSASGEDLKKVDKAYAKMNVPDETRDMVSFSIAYENGFVLTVGLFKNYEEFYQSRKGFLHRYIIEDLILVFLLIAIVSLWSLRDIQQLFERLRRGDLKGLSHLNTRSRESEMLMRGISGFAQSVDDLEHANELLGKQILPSLKKEIFSGKKPPYDFNCTLVRVDINNFSTIYNSQDVTSFMKVINEFFVEVSHVVTRYGGLIHEFVGDEVIIYFKDEDHPESFLIAMSALRDVNAVATDFNTRTTRDFGYPFTVKSSLAHGRVRFGPLVNGYTVAGSVLIETVRILSHIHEKDGNVVFFDHSHVEKLKDVVSWREGEAVRLKGFNGERILCSYDKHRSLDEILATLSMDNVWLLDFYRTDEHIMKVLKHLRAHHEDMADKVLLQALMHLRGATLTKTGVDFAKFLLTWCEELTRVTGARDDARRMTVASAVVKLLIPYVPKDTYQKDYGPRLKLLMECRDRRVVANVIEVLTHFGVPEDRKFLESLKMDSDARITANALVHAGTAEVTRKVMKDLKKMIGSSELNVVASGLFALGEIAQHHRKRDYVYFSTQIELKEMVQALPRFLTSPDKSVRRQACLAAVKVAEDDVLDEVKTIVASDPSLSLELSPLLPSRDAA